MLEILLKSEQSTAKRNGLCGFNVPGGGISSQGKELS
jgi:hypothetical protein